MRFKKFFGRAGDKIEKIPIPEKCQVLGRTMYLQNKGSQFQQLAKYGIWEEETTKYFLENVSEGDVALDVGANIGYFTLLFASLVGKEGKVFSFEPEPSNFEILKKNVKLNNFQNVELQNAAVGDSSGELELYLSEKAAGQHRIYESNNSGKNHITVRAINLDEFFNNNYLSEKISFIKIDAEGSEFGVLKGMEKILSQNKNINLIMEFSPEQIRDYGADPTVQLQYLKNLGFDFYVVDKVGKKQHKFDELEKIIKTFEGSSENILCKKTRINNSI